MQGEIIMAYIGKYLFVLLGAVQRCVQRSLQCTLQDIQSGAVSSKRPGWEAGVAAVAAKARDCCYCVIVHSVS